MLLRRRRAPEGNRTVPDDRLPAVNAHVDVVTAASGPRPSRVEDASGGVVVLSWPTDPAGYPLTGRPGDEVAVSWTSEWGMHEVVGHIAGTVREPVPQWTVRALAAPPARQRREAFRLPVRLPLVLDGGDADGGPVEATLVDLSEGGLGFVVAAGTAVRDGARMTATFALDDGDVTLDGTVVRLGEATGGERAGGLRFDEVAEEVATRLRRHVLHEQIRRRALVRD